LKFLITKFLEYQTVAITSATAAKCQKPSLKSKMLINKVISIFLVTIFLSFMAPQGPPRDDFDKKFPYGSTFKSVKCETFENNGYGYLRNCSVKAYSRKFVALNLGYTLTRPLDKPIYARIIVKFKYGNIYRDIYNLTVEICSLVENIESQALLQNLIATF
jgi:hypothetical protein